MQEVTCKRENEKWVFALFGEIDSKNADEFYDAVMAEYTLSPMDVEFDCEKLEFIDSTTLGTFVRIFKRLKTDEKQMKLVHTSARIKKLFTICALDTVMEIA